MPDFAFTDEQRLAFGHAAELYDEIRPDPPATVIDVVMAAAGLAAGDSVYEVGAGTGKATVAFAARGLRVLAIEPSPAMAALARRNCARFAGVTIVESDFEGWQPPERRPALVCFQAWHWIRPEVGYRRAHEALVARGVLAASWTFPAWERCPQREGLRQAYAAVVPEMAADFPMHPAADSTALAGDWETESVAGGHFAGPAVWEHAWTRRYSSSDYCRLLQTHQDHILLAPARRERLLAAVREALDAAGGGGLELPLISYVCTATRA
jgi:SAM-dependent methyltransferase